MFRLLKILAKHHSGEITDDGFRLINDGSELIFRRNLPHDFVSVTIHAYERKLSFTIPGQIVNHILTALVDDNFRPSTDDASSEPTVWNDKETSPFYLAPLDSFPNFYLDKSNDIPDIDNINGAF